MNKNKNGLIEKQYKTTKERFNRELEGGRAKEEYFKLNKHNKGDK